MKDYIEQIFDRADLQIIRGLLINDIGDENDRDKGPTSSGSTRRAGPCYDIWNAYTRTERSATRFLMIYPKRSSPTKMYISKSA